MAIDTVTLYLQKNVHMISITASVTIWKSSQGKTLCSNVLPPIDFHMIGLAVNKWNVLSSPAALKVACYYVQNVMNTARPVVVLATHNVIMVSTTVSSTIWRSLGSKAFGPDVLFSVDINMVRLIRNIKDFVLSPPIGRPP